VAQALFQECTYPAAKVLERIQRMAQLEQPLAVYPARAPAHDQPPRFLEPLRDLLPWALLVATVLLAVS